MLATSACLSSDVAAILPGAPSIINQPTARQVTRGDPVSFSVLATGDSLAFQWYKDAARVTGATSSTLTIANAQQADAGLYFVAVGNAVGTLVSDTARLVVVQPPAIVGYTLASGDVSSTNQAYASTTADQSAVWVSGTGNLTAINPTVTKSGDASSAAASLRSGVNAGVRSSGGTIVVVDGSITTAAVGASGLFATGTGTRVTMTRGSVTTTGASSPAIGASLGAIVDVARAKLRVGSATLISATDASTVTLLAEGDSLPGLVTADASSTVRLTLTKGATLSGAVQGASVSLDSTSTWNVTAPSAVTAFSDPLLVAGATVTNVIGNGFTVTYDSARPENAALGGRTYALTGGGSLAPR
ncbi:MAG: immunoglobulin domain-containing protein [bacterium]